MTDLSSTLATTHLLVQDGQAVVPGMPAGTQSSATGQPTTGADGAANGPGAPPATGGGGMFMLLALGAMFILMIFLSGRAQRAERKKKAELLASLSKHDRVQTIGGIIGTVCEIRDDEIVVKIDEATNAKMRFAKSAIQQVLRSAHDSSSSSTSSETTEPELASATN